MQTLAELGAWNWMILAAILFVLELTAPGIFFMWFGLAAVATGLIAFGFDVGWQWQLVWFCLLSVAFVVVAWKYLRVYPLKSERPLLNERAVRHIGESHDLIDAIVNGRGSVKIGDSIWRVTGPELPRGTRVTVVGADGSLLKVVPAGTAAAA
ncbi:MAG TPA: NfeD family protein [Methyloceanibacter sp.]|jgi:membrane protein implicated in regulation of membrane protease activity|nr:NfeD family protein [Methyloceanibacter sp.]